MGTITILDTTTKNPITLMGERAGVCYDADISNPEKNYQRGLDCIKSGHGRVMEFVNVEMIIKDFSARVIREWYTHIGGAPTRLQSSTRYIGYNNFNYVVPPFIHNNPYILKVYRDIMSHVNIAYQQLLDMDVPKEDAAMILPLGMTTTIVDKRNLRNLVDMSRQRMCSRAYLEYRLLFEMICRALSEYSDEWNTLVTILFHPKCEELRYCTEKESCGRMPQVKED